MLHTNFNIPVPEVLVFPASFLAALFLDPLSTALHKNANVALFPSVLFPHRECT